MRLCAFYLIIVFVIFGVNVNAQDEKAKIRTEEQLQAVFDDLWQVAVDRGLVRKRSKPNVYIRGRQKSRLAEAFTEAIIFYPLFFSYDYHAELLVQDYEAQRFVVGHEIGHRLLGHVDLLILVFWNESWRETRIRQECEADVFSAQLVGDDSANILRVWEVRSRRTKKGKIFSLLLSPIFGVRDAASSLKYLSNKFRNPLGKYSRRSWIHGPAHYRAILVLEGERQSCGE